MTDYPKTDSHRLILASGSPYRRDLLARVTRNFEVLAPAVDESAHAGESPAELALRLARMKATAVARLRAQAIVIGSDQVAALGSRILGKPGNEATAIQQLLDCSGQTVHFFTSVCVLNLQQQFDESYTDITRVSFRQLTSSEVRAYVKADKPLDCAGSFRAEGLGVALFDAIESRDPTAIIGLPLIWLAGCLRRAGIPILAASGHASDAA
jgi:septum formation protein